MHKLLKLGIAAGLLAGSTGFALAQDTNAGATVGVDAGAAVDAAGAAAGVDAGVDAGANATTDANSAEAGASAGGNVDANANASANASGDHNYGSLISSINGKANVDLSGVTDTTTINIVLVSSLQGEAEANAQALDNAISKEADSLATLRTDVGANATVKAKVESAGYKVDDIVALNTEADGSLTVYIDDRG